MEGKGEGMVAIVQCLRDAGLAVTLVDRRRRTGSIIAVNDSIQVGCAKSVEASAGALPAASVDTAAQICDDRYTSSYQLAHCQARPSSPPVQLTEFPPQRSEPCRTQGNFEIGNSEMKSPIDSSGSRIYTLRNSYTSVDRGLLSNARSSRCTEAFAFSLRRYPSVSPNRSISSELVQRLLAYTQAKNFSKSSYHSKSMRSLRTKAESPKEITHITNSTKSVQTYTRTKVKKAPTVEKEGKENGKEEKRPRSPVRSFRDVRYKDSHINATYDYLKSTSPRRYSAIATDVRYLSDVTRCLRDTLRQICDDQPGVCPNIQNRYNQHLREHHSHGSQDSAETKNTPRASVPMVSTGVPAMSSCEAMEGLYLPTCSSRPKLCCYCKKPLPCPCPQKSSVQSQLRRKSSVDSNARTRSYKRNCFCKDMPVDEFEKNLKEQVFSWLDELPVYANDKPEDRRAREHMARQLVEKLKGFKDDEDFEEKAKAAFTECVENMPIWYPGNKENQDMFKQQIADSLMGKIRNITKRVDRLESEISKFVDNLNLKARDSKGQVIDKQTVVDNLVNKLKPLASNQPADSKSYKDTLKSTIADILEELPIQINGDKKAYLNYLADKLAMELYKIPAEDIPIQSSADSLEDEFQKQIWQWLEDIPEFSTASASKIAENQKSVKALANKLQKIQAEGIEDSGMQEEMQNEINDWLETKVGKKSRLDSKTKSNLADKLVGKLVNVTKSAGIKKTKTPLNKNFMIQQIRDWVNDIPELSGGNEEENKQMVEQLANKLFELRSQGKDDNELEDEVLDWLTTSFENQGKRLNIRHQGKLVNQLLSKIKTLSDDQVDENLIQDIWDCLKNIPELDTTSKEIKKLVEQLANKMQELQSQKRGDIDDKERKDEINDWLDDFAKSAGTKLSTKTRNQLMQNLMNISKSEPKPRKRWSKQDNAQQAISDGIASILEGSSLKLANGNKKDLQNKISNLLSRNIDTVKSGDEENEIKSKIIDILKKEAQLPVGKAKKIADDIINKVQSITIPEPSIGINSNPLNVQQVISDGISNILEGSSIKLANGNKKDIQNKISNVLSRNIDTVQSGDNKNEIKSMIVGILKEEAQLPAGKAKRIADDIINKVQSMTLPEPSIGVNSDLLKNSLRNEVSFTLDEFNVHGDNREQLESFLTDVLAEQVMHGESDSETKDKLIRVLEPYIPQKQTEKIASQLIDTAKEVSWSHRTQGSQTLSPMQKEVFQGTVKQEIVLSDQIMRGESDSQTKDKLMRAVDSDIPREQTDEISSKLIGSPKKVSLSNRTKSYEPLSPMQKGVFQNCAEREIVDFIQGLTGDSSDMSRIQYKAAAENLAQRVGDIMSQKDATDGEIREDIESEISKYLQSLSVDINGFEASQLAEKLQNIAFKTSTPNRSSNRDSFRPRRDSTASTISAIDETSDFKMAAPTKEEEKYMNELADIIKDWVNNLPIDLDTEGRKDFKEVMIKNLAEEIVDRQKYLQLNPDARTSNDEELEHLKYQVFRWLNKVPNLKDIMPSIAETEHLMNLIKALPVPRLIMRKRRHAYIQQISRQLSLIEDEIQKWIQAIPSKFYAISDKDLHQQMVKSLAEQINELQRDDELSENLLEDVVTDFLQKMLKEYNEEYFSSLTEGLKAVLLNKGLVSLLESSLLASQNSLVMQQKLNSVLLDWLKVKPLYQRRLSSEKREQEKLIAKLSESLKDTLRAPYPSDQHKEERVLDEIKSHLKRFPMESKIRVDEEFHDSTANDLLEYLKMLNLFQIESKDQDVIVPLLEKWIDSLPLVIQISSIDYKKIESLTKEFAQTLHQLKQQHPTPNETASNILKEEIKKYMQRLPIDPVKKNDQQFIFDKVEELHQKLLDVQSQLMTSRPSISVDDLKEVILTWGKKLPFEPGKSIEKYKPEVDKVVPKVKTILSKVPAETIDKVKPELEKEINTFVKKLPLQKNKLKDDHIKDLTNRLNDFVQTTAAEGPSRMKDGKRSSISSYKKAPDLLYDKDNNISDLANQSNDFDKTAALAGPSMMTDDSVTSKSGFKKAADVLYDNVADWCDKLPIESGNTPEGNEKTKTLKQNIASKLINIIGELNVNPEIFNDDALYEDLLNDEIDNLLSTLPPSAGLENKLPALKENLIEKVKEAKAKTQDELAGQVYKQQLRDAISKTLPSIEDQSSEEQAPFEVLKDNLADAYINLHFAAADEDMKRKLKNKISDAIKEFCDDYLQRYPSSPVDAKKLNKELYDALQKVPVPKDETIKSQVEQVRIKDEINDWLKELPLKEDESPTEQLQRNKIVSVLAKRLHDIEKDKEFNPDLDVGERMQKEIKKWIKKLPIIPGEEDKAEKLLEQLVSKLKDSEESRRFSVSNIRHSIDTSEGTSPSGEVHRTPEVQAPPCFNRYLSQYAPPFPTSTLSTDDRAHLERIRQRNQQQQLCFEPAAVVAPQPCHCRDASVSPIPIDAGSQTDVGPGNAQAIQSQMVPGSNGPASSADHGQRLQAPGSPLVVVKEYYWDSPDSALRGQGQSASCQGLPGSPQQPPQFSWPQSHVNLPRFDQQPTPCSGPQSMFPSADQTRTPQAPCMIPPPLTQQSGLTQPPCISTPPIPHQAPCMPQPQIRSQSPGSSQPTSVPYQPSGTRPYPSAPPMPPCMLSRPSPHMPPSMNQPQSPYPQTPCMKSPQMSQPQMPPCLSQERSRHIPPCSPQGNRSRKSRHPCFGSADISSTSSPFDTGTDIDRFGPKVTRLGSLDDVPCTRPCGSLSPMAKRSRGSPFEDYDLNIRFPEDQGHWGTPCPRRRPHRSPMRSPEGVPVKEKERKENCRCRERMIAKCMGRRPLTCNSRQMDDDSMSHCSKCCGTHCPRPSYLFFRQ